MIREARQAKGWTIAQLAERIGRPREWLNRVELGYGEFGEVRPPNGAPLRQLADCLGIDQASVVALGTQAEQDYKALFLTSRSAKTRAGKVIQDEVIVGEAEIYAAAENLINEQHSDALIRTTGIWSHANTSLAAVPEWKKYRQRLGKFISDNRQSGIKRAEYLGTKRNFDIAMAADKLLAQKQTIPSNVKIKFFKYNPVILDVLIGQREAIIAFPQRTGYQGLTVGLLVRDKLFVESLRTWFDEVVWESGFENRNLNFNNLLASLEDIRNLYDYM